MNHLHARKQPEGHRLRGERERTGDQRLAGDDRSHGRQWNHQHPQGFTRHRTVEHIPADNLLAREQESRLPRVVERESRKHEPQPGDPDGLGTEVTKVRPEGFATRDGENDRTQNQDGTVPAMVPQEGQAVERVERPQDDLGVVSNLVDAHRSDRQEPDRRAGTEHRTDLGRTLVLDHEETGEDDQGEGDDEGLQARVQHHQTLDRREHGDSRGDDPVPVQQAGREDQEGSQPEHDAGLAVAGREPELGQEREHATLAVVVGLEHVHHVLCRHQGDEGPDHQAGDTDGVASQKRLGVLDDLVAGLVEGVQRRGADVTVDDAQSRDHERDEADLVGVVGGGTVGVRALNRCRGLRRPPDISLFRPLAEKPQADGPLGSFVSSSRHYTLLLKPTESHTVTIASFHRCWLYGHGLLGLGRVALGCHGIASYTLIHPIAFSLRKLPHT